MIVIIVIKYILCVIHLHIFHWTLETTVDSGTVGLGIFGIGPACKKICICIVM